MIKILPLSKKSKHIMNIDLSDEETNLRASITAFASALKMNSYVDDKPVCIKCLCMCVCVKGEGGGQTGPHYKTDESNWVCSMESNSRKLALITKQTN
jgi:hypothetical protein